MKELTYKVGESGVRPWGEWFVVGLLPNCVLKKIIVNPGQCLSLQSHKHRQERWIVAHGEAIVTLDTKRIVLTAGETVFVPKGAMHRVANESTEPLYFVELQMGEILCESDIVRYHDIYGRVDD